MENVNADLSISRLIRAPRRAIWQAWAEPELFARWWIPAPIECRVVQLDLTPGGGFETRMRQPGQEVQPNLEGCFVEVVPGERLAFTTCLTAGWRPHTPWLALTAIMTLTEEAGGTRYCARVLHRDAAEAAKHRAMGFSEGWGTVIGQLAALVEPA